jgi:hypothetical protein
MHHGILKAIRTLVEATDMTEENSGKKADHQGEGKSFEWTLDTPSPFKSLDVQQLLRLTWPIILAAWLLVSAALFLLS